jgi:phosphoadenosine phosphosulfate reductase
MPSNPRQILQWTLRTYPKRTAITVSFGGAGLVLAHVLSELDPTVPLLFADTGYLFPETLAFRDDFIRRYRLKVLTLTPAEDPGPIYLDDPDRCCHLRKVAPVHKALANYDAWVSAVRREQSDTRASLDLREAHYVDGRPILKVHPLFDWSRADVDRYYAEHDLPQHPLVAQGYVSIGCWPCTSPVLPGEPERAGRWRGRGKTECGLHVRTS